MLTQVSPMSSTDELNKSSLTDDHPDTEKPSARNTSDLGNYLFTPNEPLTSRDAEQKAKFLRGMIVCTTPISRNKGS
jgi:hypothetical protein